MHMLHKIATAVVKYGGNAMNPGADEALLDDVATLRGAGTAVVLVHGGGPDIDAVLDARGIRTERVDGLRITGADAIDAIEAVLCGTANKRLVRACARRGIPAIGISGEDGGLIRARRQTSPSGADLGFVGEVVAVDPAPLLALLNAGYLPVVSPVAVAADGTCAYNVNADTAAGAIAAALKADAYVAVTNVQRVRANPGDATSGIDVMNLSRARTFAQSDACEGGMRPKLLAAIAAVAGGAARAYIGGSSPRAVSAALAGNATTIVP